MVNAVNSAISAKADGIAVSLVDPTAFNAPVKSALSAGIPVVSYNADVEPPNNERLAYIGQNLEVSGEKMGEHIAELVPSGDVALFIATPGSLNIQPRHRRRAEVPENQAGDQNPHGRDGRRGPAGAHGDRIVSGGPP